MRRAALRAWPIHETVYGAAASTFSPTGQKRDNRPQDSQNSIVTAAFLVPDRK